MMTMKIKEIAIPVILMMVGICSCNSPDSRYLRSLNVEHEFLNAVDSISLEPYGVYAPNKIVRVNDSLMVLSLWKGDHHLLMLNIDEKDCNPLFYLFILLIISAFIVTPK